RCEPHAGLQPKSNTTILSRRTGQEALPPCPPRTTPIARHSAERIDRGGPACPGACRAAAGMGFTAVARVTGDRWITCASLDHLNFGLRPGDELDVTSTICHEVRAYCDTIVIPDVDASKV